MPHQAGTTPELRKEKLIVLLTSAITLFNELGDAFGTPFAAAISSTVQSLVVIMQNVKKQKEECLELLETVQDVLYTIVNLHLQTEPPGSLPPSMLYHVGMFTETLHRIHMFIEAQQHKSGIKYFFRQTEMAILLKDCRENLRNACEAFKVKTGANTLSNIAEMQTKAESIKHLRFIPGPILLQTGEL
ncbi:hypothetical protein MVEN_00179800 [Mycena venus]|uniref:Uncharacterized protein n=1 Tax=Mycena venus TaxID=2733690 RepID=A0A8H6YWU9_9AGAR|nr:hypothetical protein MVEN_00179800 [Mycena venus]